MQEFLELRQVVTGLIGGVIGAGLALLSRAFTERLARARLAKRLARAFWEELAAIEFNGQGGFAGFTSQTFDTLFREMANALPENLTRKLMRYHWRMKFLEEMKPTPHPKFAAEAEQSNQDLRGRLDRYADRKTLSVFLWHGEVGP